jgi:hypothetical protein
MPLPRNRPRDGLGHLKLLRPMLVVRQPRRNAAAWPKNVRNAKFHAANVADNRINRQAPRQADDSVGVSPSIRAELIAKLNEPVDGFRRLFQFAERR